MFEPVERLETIKRTLCEVCKLYINHYANCTLAR